MCKLFSYYLSHDFVSGIPKSECLARIYLQSFKSISLCIYPVCPGNPTPGCHMFKSQFISTVS